jgi:hypothetical protein
MNPAKTRSMFLAAMVAVFCLAYSANAQQIPAGVRYKKASDEINQKAKSILESALMAKADAVNLESISDGIIVCGPLLWDALKDQAGKELREAKLMMVVIGSAKPLTKEGRGIVTMEQKRAFWKLFVEKVKANNSFMVRKAEAPEIQYYWATIPFDIEEPLYIVDFGKVKVLVNFTVKNGEPKLFWMDIVGDLATLK